MATITAAMVKELRDKTDAGMMDCKKALTETNGDMEAAVEYLRKAGITKAEKRAERQTKEGRVCIAVEGNKAVMIEVLSETDFVAKNEKFGDYVKAAAGRILAGTSGDGDITAKAQELEATNLKELSGVIGENMQLRRAVRVESAGKIGSYIRHCRCRRRDPRVRHRGRHLSARDRFQTSVRLLLCGSRRCGQQGKRDCLGPAGQRSQDGRQTRRNERKDRHGQDRQMV